MGGEGKLFTDIGDGWSGWAGEPGATLLWHWVTSHLTQAGSALPAFQSPINNNTGQADTERKLSHLQIQCRTVLLITALVMVIPPNNCNFQLKNILGLKLDIALLKFKYVNSRDSEFP